MIKAIVYTSKTGTTEWYAERIGTEKNLPVLTLKEAEKKLEKGSGIIYLGCIRADIISGLDKTKALFSPLLIIGVGMTKSGERTREVLKANNLDSSATLFTLQGGYVPSRLKGIEKLILSSVVKQEIKNLERKEKRTKEDEEMLSLLKNGGVIRDQEKLNEIMSALDEMEKRQ